MSNLQPEILKYLADNRQRYLDKVVEMARIPAPSNQEEKRAAYCKAYLESFGAKGVYIDEALNVVYPYYADGCNDLVAFLGHTDIVFPDTEEIPVRVEDGRIYGPGVGDDTANAVAVMEMARMVTELGLKPKRGILFVCNSGEEGLGNLKGSRQIMKDYAGRIGEMIGVDAGYRCLYNDAVGSKRYQITIKTEGGHSYSAFGNRNAIYYASLLINTFYGLKVPEGGKTTYNVGIIQGGTSVNTIAQECSMLYEYRSDRREALAYMDKMFEATIAAFSTMGIQVEVKLMGDRPCKGEVDVQPLTDKVVAIAASYGEKMETAPGSTDCNIPLAQGVPAVCFGVYLGAGAHTREEWIDIASTEVGMKILAEVVMSYFG